MEKKVLEEINGIINEEIVNYNEIKMLYEEKRKILTQHRVDELLNIDLEISEKIKSIKKVAHKRRYITSKEGYKEMKLSDLIEKTKKLDKELYEKFSEQKTKLKELAQDIKVLEMTNRELTRHGLIIANKTINLIFNQSIVNAEEYDKRGKNKNNLEFSSIVENV